MKLPAARRIGIGPWPIRVAHWLITLLVFFLVFNHLPPAHAQPTTQPAANYWQHSASGRLRQVVTADVNYDGVDEFLVADENGKVDLLRSFDGTRQWSYTAQEPVLVVDTLNLDGPQRSPREIVLAMRNRVVLLTATGALIKQFRLTSRSHQALDPIVEEAERLSLESGELALIPIDLAAYDWNGDGMEEVLLLLDTGALQLYDANGALLWERPGTTNNTNSDPHLTVADFDGDGKSEIVLAIFTPRRFGQLVYIDNEESRWELSVSGRITAVLPVYFAANEPPSMAISTNLGHLYVYSAQRQRVWLRTLNRAITALTTVQLPQGPAIVAGTDVGTVVAYDHNGRRYWTQNLSPEANRRILSLSGAAYTPADGQPALAALIEPKLRNATGTADMILLGNNRQTLGKFEGVDALGLTRLLDINRDQNSELLIVHFATLELAGLSISTGTSGSKWEHSLNAAPLSMLVIDFDKDGQDEVVVGTQDGRIHSLSNNGSIRSLNDPGGAITHLAALPGAPTQSQQMVVVRNQINNDELAESRSWVEIRQANGEKIREQQLTEIITSLLVDDVDNASGTEIVVGTQSGTLYVYDEHGAYLWNHTIDTVGRINYLLLVKGNDRRPSEIIVGTQHHILAVREIGQSIINRPLAQYEGTITNIQQVQHPLDNELSVSLLVFVNDGNVYGLNWRGILLAHLPWPLTLNGVPTIAIPTNQTITEAFLEKADAFLVATSSNTLTRLDLEENRPILSWELKGLGAITSLYWDDWDGDALPETAVVGNKRGKVSIFNRTQTREPKLVEEIDLFSSVFALTVLQRGSQKPDLLFVTENGLMQLFQAQENRPPLLTNPGVEVALGQYSINVSVRDMESDRVKVRLDLQDTNTGEWLPQEEKTLSSGVESLFWLVNNPPVAADGVHYRFYYSDGFYQGYVTPPVGPIPQAITSLANASRYSILLLGFLGLAMGALLVQQNQSSDARARRLYKRLKQAPEQTLLLLEARYAYHDGSPNFLLYLANRARQESNRLVAGLVDGLFLLENRPRTGLSIMTSTLKEIGQVLPPWQGIQRWQLIYHVGQKLLEAPSITELSLLRPQLVELLTILENEDQFLPVLDILLPILTNLGDSERVELADDRLVYLNEAAVLLGRLESQLPEFSPTIERTLVQGIVKRWAGLVSTTIEELRGRAELMVTLKTKQLVPNGQTHVAIEIQNNGRAPAENIIAVLDENPAYKVNSLPQTIPILPSGRKRQIEFVIQPIVSDRFRLSVALTYDDRNQRDKGLAFGDMVHLLPPVRDFKPIDNPYMPGTPLRPNSNLFFGREHLFSFIAENAGHRSHRNVLILVGQRRTGKTSALLRLEEHLPRHLLPVYIDCQSLGVIPGMPALLQELAWLIADALAARGVDIEVPEPAQWQEEPTRQFQRHFLPRVQALLPSGTTLLLVFDEFEAFENLVDDGILPSTFFTYLRHLMQHSEGLNFIFVGTRRLEEMSADYWSVLFNIALYRKIDYLSAEAAQRLVTKPVEPHLVYDDLALDKVLRVTAGHPYFLQLVCYTLVKRANTEKTGYITISDVNAALDEMLRLGEVHFAYLWQRSSYAERALLTAVAHLMDRDIPFHPEDLVDFLRPHAINLNPAEITNALNRLVERDIMREVTEEAKTLYELRIALIGLWVAQNKSLSKLHSNTAGEANETASRPKGKATAVASAN